MNYNDLTFVTCFKCLYVFENKNQAVEHFKFCQRLKDGEEKKCYDSILEDLKFSNIGRDRVNDMCDEIRIIPKDMLHIAIANSLSTHEIIEFFYKKIQPILEVSDDYGVDFTRDVPFEYFGSDDEIDYMSSFSKYYKEILKNDAINSIVTSELSDGKYTMKVELENKNAFYIDLRAWEKLESVIDNVDVINDEIAQAKQNSVDLEGMEKIEIEINNNGILRLSQTEADKARYGIGLESINDKGEVYRRDLIDEGDFVMLMNYYRFIKDHDIKDDFINRDGVNAREDYGLASNNLEI